MVFGPAPQTLAAEKFLPMQSCGEEVSVGGFVDTPTHILSSDSDRVGAVSSIYYDRPYPGGFGEYTLCWDDAPYAAARGSVFSLEVTLCAATGVLFCTSLYCTVVSWYFSRKFESDWKKLGKCATASTCLYRRVVEPMQWWVFMFLWLPEFMLLIYIMLGVCQEVLDAYGATVFFTVLATWVVMACLLWTLQCCAGFFFKSR